MALAATCTRDGGPRIGQFMNTTPNVADVVEIIERLGEWRQQESEEILAGQPMMSESEKQTIRDANRRRKGEELLQFWGFLTVQLWVQHSQRCNLIVSSV
ncbi:uncharacterized protein N7483_000125 [Penicillium malachiteum]|uniref:uncharacterized protein n=1 Tax=Penicillium malachiteum TaxID=1324776 RepID=UPI002547FF32|nr:uncharacterized protein N7483_000125 [Penicillium malachiteum]KAJ5735000.1 hypothetical protein N7483_000125 [Penicillium malachiteum]